MEQNCSPGPFSHHSHQNSLLESLPSVTKATPETPFFTYEISSNSSTIQRELKFAHPFWKAIGQAFRIKNVYICGPEQLLGMDPTTIPAEGRVCVHEDGSSAQCCLPSLKMGDSLRLGRDQVSDSSTATWRDHRGTTLPQRTR